MTLNARPVTLLLALAPAWGCIGAPDPAIDSGDSAVLDTGGPVPEPSLCEAPTQAQARAQAARVCSSGGYAAVLEDGTAYGTIQDAVDGAGGLAVFVCPGTHTERIRSSGSALVLASASGTSADTLLSGEGSRGILSGTATQLAVYNLSFIEGRRRNGGAIDAAGDLSVYCSTFTDNEAVYSGGAAFAQGDLYVTDSHFEGNLSGYEGGALTAYGVGLIESSTFELNYAHYEGGAITASDDLTLSGSVFTDNSAGYEGGAASFGSRTARTLTVSGSEFYNNVADYAGGALDIGSWADGDQVFIDGSWFEGNSSNYEGGAIELGTWGYADLYATDTSFVGNSSAGSGGVIDLGGWSTGTSANFEGVTFDGNVAADGGVLSVGSRVTNAWVDLTDCTLSSNVSSNAVVAVSSYTDTSSDTTDWSASSSGVDNAAADFDGPCGRFSNLGAGETFNCARSGAFTR